MKPIIEKLLPLSISTVTLAFTVLAYLTGKSSFVNIAHTLGVICLLLTIIGIITLLFLLADPGSVTGLKIFGKKKMPFRLLSRFLSYVTYFLFIAMGWTVIGGLLIVLNVLFLAVMQTGRDKLKALKSV